VLWTPAFEELAFRGLLYFSLRHRLGPVAAATLTAGFFAGLHFYSLPGFLMTFWSGFVWALAFERAGSLLPGIGAHALYNGLYVAGLLLAYR
jgi:membrane protease YdiL (CAAX protease family)